MSAFFAMGGYALYVWGSYGLAALLLVGLLLASLSWLRSQERLLAALESAREGQSRRRQGRREQQDGGDGDGTVLLMTLGSGDSGRGGKGSPAKNADDGAGDGADGADGGGGGDGGGGE